MKQYFYILLLYTLLNCSFILTDTSVKEDTNSGRNSTNNTNIVLTEGGKINITSKVTDGREHGLQLTTQATVEKKLNMTTNTATLQQSTTAVMNSTTVKPFVKPVTEVETVGDGKVKARKGVTLTEVTSNTTSPNATQSSTTTPSMTTTTTTTTLTPSTTVFIPRKPTVTTGDEDDNPGLFHSNSRVFNLGKEIAPKNSTQSPPLPKEEPVLVGLGSRHVKGSDYVLTIVLIILAVPLVAIILTVLYKRSAEWWSHRHYRRMDFLIDGMYNN